MVDLTREPEEVFRDFVVEADPGSGAHPPVKAHIRTLLREVVDDLDISGGAEFAFNTAESLGIAEGVASQGTAYDSAVASVLADGQKEIYFPDGDFDLTGTATPHQVFHIGDGNITGSYRTKAHRPMNGSWPSWSDIVPQRHLKRFLATQAPKVVIMGDSTATDFADAITRADSLWYKIKKKLSDKYPSKTITFVNRAVGATIWNEADTEATTAPNAPWYINWDADIWLDYILADAPDLLIFSFGMNDSNDFQDEKLRSVYDKVMAWTKKPDIIYCTPAVPTLTDGSEAMSAEWTQEGRDYVAGFTRYFAQYKDVGLLDFNRMYNLVRDGRDVCTSYMEHVVTDLVTTPNYTAPATYKTRAYAMDIVFPSIPANHFTQSGQALSFEWVGELAMNALYPSIEHKVLIDSSGGFIRTRVLGATSNILKTVISGLATPTSGTVRVRAIMSGSYVQIIFGDDPNGYTVFEGSTYKHGGKNLPKVQFQTNAYHPSMTLNLYIARDMDHTPKLLNDEIWGLVSDNKEPFGGNGLNHFRSQAAAAVYQHVLDMTDWGANTGPLVMETYTVATAPAAPTHDQAMIAYFSNGASGAACIGVWDEVAGQWKRIALGAAIAAS